MSDLKPCRCGCGGKIRPEAVASVLAGMAMRDTPAPAACKESLHTDPKPCLNCKGEGSWEVRPGGPRYTCGCCTPAPAGAQAVGDGWEDRDSPESPAIEAAHPCETGDSKTHAEAMRLVGDRHSKHALVDLVNWLLVTRAAALAEIETLKLDNRQDCVRLNDAVVAADTLIAQLTGALLAWKNSINVIEHTEAIREREIALAAAERHGKEK